MIHPSTELRFIDAEVGYGVFATAEIPCGTLVWVLDPFDRMLDRATVEQFPAPLRDAVRRGAFLDAAGDLVFCWDHGRHVNHSCAPNCLELGTSFEIAARTILPGEELSCDYGSIGVIQPFPCRCGATRCRGVIGESAAAEIDITGDPVLSAAWREAARVEQPLLSFAVPVERERSLLRSLRARRARRRARITRVLPTSATPSHQGLGRAAR